MIGRNITLLLVAWFALWACNGDDAVNESQAGSGSGTAGDSADVAISGSPCEKICEIMEALKCPNDNPATCIRTCNTYWSYEPCETELRALLNCAVQYEQSSWECDEIDEANVKAGLCDAENTAAKNCVAESQ